MLLVDASSAGTHRSVCLVEGDKAEWSQREAVLNDRINVLSAENEHLAKATRKWQQRKAKLNKEMQELRDQIVGV